LGQVKQDEDVAERVCHDGHPADREVEGPGHYPPARRPDRVGCLVGGGDKPVRFVALPGCEDDFGVAADQGQAGLSDVIMAPPQFMPERALAQVEPGFVMQRDRLIREAGYQVVHITWKELFERPGRVIGRILTAFRAASPY
jgi:hypothetical protein